ncbi:MAG: hypothetical protein [Bacteriophage sp.]|nr:MAG: hypothetical protein [Bacteriophage sp.]
MSYTYVTNIGDGVTRSFPFSFAGQDNGYLSTSNIVVYIGGTPVGGYEIKPSSPNVIQFNTAPPIGAEILIRRVMPKNVPYADFSRGNPFNQDTLNNTNLQMLYLLQEIYDGYLPDGFYFRVNIDMRGMKLINLGRGTDYGDSVNYDQFEEQVHKIEAIEDAVLHGDMSIRNVSFRITSTNNMVSWTPGIVFTNAYLYINGVWQNKLDGAFSIVNNTIYFAEALPAGLQVYALLGTGPALPDDYKTEDELEALYFNGIFQRLSTLEGNVADFGGQISAVSLQVNQNGQAITTLTNRVSSLETRVQPINLGGTGNTVGRAATATKLDVPRGLRVSLANSNAVNFDGSADVSNIGVSGLLPLANGGLGASYSTLADVLTAMGGVPVNGTTVAPATGKVGELLEVTGTSTSLTTATFTTAASLVLTPGVWEVSGNILLTSTAASISAYNIGIAQTQGAGAGFPRACAYNGPSINQGGQSLPSQRLVITSNTTVYAIAWASFASGTVTAQAFIHAHRVR